MRHLRSPQGCPWDREQTHQTLRKFLIEECYEVVEAVESGAPDRLCEELGDLLLLIVFHAQLAAEAGHFDAADVARGIDQKLRRRHQHVFGSAQADTPEEVLSLWRFLKAQEAGSELGGTVSDVGAPALLTAQMAQSRAAQVGFDWAGVDGPLAKLKEEMGELDQAAARGGEQVEEEVGDLLFSVVNVARFLGLDAEACLRRTLRKWEARWRAIQDEAVRQGKSLTEMSLAEMDAIWEAAKSPPAEE